MISFGNVLFLSLAGDVSVFSAVVKRFPPWVLLCWWIGASQAADTAPLGMSGNVPAEPCRRFGFLARCGVPKAFAARSDPNSREKLGIQR